MFEPELDRTMDLFPTKRITPLPGGYMGKILCVDLITTSTRDENLPEEPILKNSSAANRWHPTSS